MSPTEAIRTPEDALAYATQQVAKLHQARDAMLATALATEQQRLYQTLLIRYGAALSALAVLRCCGLLPDDAYGRLRDETMAGLAPQLIRTS